MHAWIHLLSECAYYFPSFCTWEFFESLSTNACVQYAKIFLCITKVNFHESIYWSSINNLKFPRVRKFLFLALPRNYDVGVIGFCAFWGALFTWVPSPVTIRGALLTWVPLPLMIPCAKFKWIHSSLMFSGNNLSFTNKISFLYSVKSLTQNVFYDEHLDHDGGDTSNSQIALMKTIFPDNVFPFLWYPDKIVLPARR